MASVFLSLFPNGDGTSRKIVLKQLHPELAMDDDFRAMFEDEARVATRLHHDNVVETYDIYSDLDLCVLVMEFLDGQTLSRIRQRARAVGNIPLSIHLRVLAEVLAGLHYVHELTDHGGKPLGIVHRDVTPSNVFITYDGRVKLVDFGIAKATTRIAETRMGVLKGKLAYMSPEAVRGEPVDRRSDIFSVGVMLWEAATGLRLWQDHDEIAVFRRLAIGDLPLCRAGAQITSPVLLLIANRALAVDPCQRYDSAEEMQHELENLLVKLGEATRAPALSTYLESSFAADREKFQKIVDKTLARSPRHPASQRRPVGNALGDSYPGLDPSEPPTTVSAPSGKTFRGASYDVPLEPGELPDFRPHRHGFLLGAVAAAISVGVAVVANSPASLQRSWPAPALHASPSANAIAGPLIANPAAVAKPAVSTNPPGGATLAVSANPAIASLAATAAPRPTAVDLSIPSAPASAGTGSPLQPSAPAKKARRDKHAPDREDPWGL
jgi:serine/threonine-protein kinase